MDATLAEFLAEGLVRKWEGTIPPCCVLPLNVIPTKQLANFQVLLDGRHMNGYVSWPKFKFDKLRGPEHLVEEGEFLVGVDLTSSYW